MQDTCATICNDLLQLIELQKPPRQVLGSSDPAFYRCQRRCTWRFVAPCNDSRRIGSALPQRKDQLMGKHVRATAIKPVHANLVDIARLLEQSESLLSDCPM
jgi:hypothetical protein